MATRGIKGTEGGNSGFEGAEGVLLRAHGFTPDYMERCITSTDACNGYSEGRKCHCFRQAEMKYPYAQSNIEEIVTLENIFYLFF